MSTTTRCAHRSLHRVTSTVTGELLAKLCRTCGEQLPAEFVPPSRVDTIRPRRRVVAEAPADEAPADDGLSRAGQIGLGLFALIPLAVGVMGMGVTLDFLDWAGTEWYEYGILILPLFMFVVAGFLLFGAIFGGRE
jgi:hypothetical protein